MAPAQPPGRVTAILRHNIDAFRECRLLDQRSVVAAAVYVVFYYNRLVRARNMLQEGWSGIDVQLRRRADLVPNLNRDGQRLRRACARHLRGPGR